MRDLPYFDSVEEAERKIKSIILDAMNEYKDITIDPAPRGEVCIHYRSTVGEHSLDVPISFHSF